MTRRTTGYRNEHKELPFKPHFGRLRKSQANSDTQSFFKQLQNLSCKTKKVFGQSTYRGGVGVIVSQPRIFSQRAIIKSRIVRTGGHGKDVILKHVNYLQRDGVGLDGKEPKVFSIDEELAPEKVQAWAEKCIDDRHHFRFIISPENASELDLPIFAKELMGQMERDVGSALDWIAVGHYNTDNPHVHILLRGVDEQGKDLVINRDYMALGFRNRAQEIATRELGPRTALDIEREIQKGINQARIIGLDREFVREIADKPGRHLVDVRESPPIAFHSLVRHRNNRIRRLQFLEQLGFAREVESGLWHVDENLLGKLRDLSVQNDIIKTMHLHMRGIEPASEMLIFDPKTPPEKPLSGEVIHVGLADELYDEKYVMIRTKDGQAVYVALGPKSANKELSLSRGDVVQISISKRNFLTKADRNISEFASENQGIYDQQRHIHHVQTTMHLPHGVTAEDFVANHRKRLNSLARLGFVEELTEGKWKIPNDLVSQLQKKAKNELQIEHLEKKRDLRKSLSRGV